MAMCDGHVLARRRRSAFRVAAVRSSKCLVVVLSIGACGSPQSAPVSSPTGSGAAVTVPATDGGAISLKGNAVQVGTCSGGAFSLGPATVIPVDGATGDLGTGDVN